MENLTRPLLKLCPVQPGMAGALHQAAGLAWTVPGSEHGRMTGKVDHHKQCGAHVAISGPVALQPGHAVMPGPS